jgi:hypothetical protein
VRQQSTREADLGQLLFLYAGIARLCPLIPAYLELNPYRVKYKKRSDYRLITTSFAFIVLQD